MVIYVRTQGARIVKEGKHLLVKKGETIYHTLFTYKLRQVVIFGSVEITHRALVQLMRHNVDIVFMTYNGRYLGRIAPPESKNVFLHKRQYKLLDDYEFGLRLARSIVAGKLANMATLLMRIKRSKKDTYTFLMNRVYAAIRITGLDPYPGFLHTIDYGRYSLVLDLMEEFRPIIADTLTLSLFNLKILQNEDFYVERPESIKPSQNETDKFPDVTRDPIGLISLDESGEDIFDLPEQRIEESISGSVEPMGKYPVKLNGDAFNRVIEAFEKKLTTSFYYPPAERKLTYGDAIYYQAGLLRKVIEGEVKLYQPLLLK